MQKIRLFITALGHAGEGIGSLDGLKVFVDEALPGEEHEVLITSTKKNFAIGRSLKILSAAKHRQTPQCPLFGKCGGCQLMHLDYSAQLEAKKERVVNALKRIGHIDSSQYSLHPPLASPLTTHYRNKIQLPFFWDGQQMRVGLYRKNSHEVIPLTECHIHCKMGEKILGAILALLPKKPLPLKTLLIRSATLSNQALVVFVTGQSCSKELMSLSEKLQEICPEVQGVLENINPRNDNTLLGTTFTPIVGKECIYETLLGKSFKISPEAFFQVNPLVAEKIYLKAIEFAQLKKNETVIDAFCGVGGLAILAAEFVQESIGIEIVSRAIVNAKENASINLVKNTQFLVGKAETLLPQCKKADVLFLNPPRKGCEPTLLAALPSLKARAIVYISCDPATLARDIALLQPLGYALKEVQPFDLFPQTMHIETVALLIRTSQQT